MVIPTPFSGVWVATEEKKASSSSGRKRLGTMPPSSQNLFENQNGHA